MNINVHFKQRNIIHYSMFVRYYADPNMKSDVILINHGPEIPRCTIASKVSNTKNAVNLTHLKIRKLITLRF